MKKYFILLLALALLLSTLGVVIAQDTFSNHDIREILEDEDALQFHIDTANGILDRAPSFLRKFILKDNEIIHLIVGGSTIEIKLQGGKVVSLTTGITSQASIVVRAKYGTIRDLVNSDDLLNNLWKSINKGKINIRRTDKVKCTENIQCNDDQVCTSSGCKDAFTLVVTPFGFSDDATFLSAAEKRVEEFIEVAPVEEKNVRVHYVSTSVCGPSMAECTNACGDCNSQVRDCAKKAGLKGVADKVAGLAPGDKPLYVGSQRLCGCAANIPALTSLTAAHDQACVSTLPHEVGHSLGLWHVDSTGKEAGACNGPNANDCKEPNKGTFIMGYNGANRNTYGPAGITHLESQVGGQ